jgi:hypothetical protein
MPVFIERGRAILPLHRSRVGTLVIAACLSLSAATTATAQAGFIKPERHDSLTSRIRTSFLLFRDTLRTVDSRSALLQRDIRFASNAVLISRARSIEQACTASLGMLDETRKTLFTPEAIQKLAADRRVALERSFEQLKITLGSCTTEFQQLATERGVDLKGRGATHSGRNQDSIENFESAAVYYLGVLGVRIRPYGSGENPYAGGGREN